MARREQRQVACVFSAFRGFLLPDDSPDQPLELSIDQPAGCASLKSPPAVVRLGAVEFQNSGAESFSR